MKDKTINEKQPKVREQELLKEDKIKMHNTIDTFFDKMDNALNTFHKRQLELLLKINEGLMDLEGKLSEKEKQTNQESMFKDINELLCKELDKIKQRVIDEEEKRSLGANPQDKQSEEQDKEKQVEEKRAKKEQKREEFSKSAVIQINKALNAFEEKIGTVSQHPYTKAFITANQLLKALNKAKTQYLIDLKQMDKKTTAVNDLFYEKCSLLIAQAKPVLERDLGWGDYLTNLLKAIGKAIWGAFGKTSTMFTPVRSESLKMVEEAEVNLKLQS